MLGMATVLPQVANASVIMKTLNQKDVDNHNWLGPRDEGCMVMVTGHWSGDFCGVVEYGGNNLAIVIDADGRHREICYLYPVEFVKL